MLQIIYSPDWRALSRGVRTEIVHRCEQGQKGQILIVPEQFSFETECLLCAQGGPQLSRFAEVLSFSRLAERSAGVCGGIARPIMDQGGRIMALASAVEQLRPKLKFYARSARRSDFLLQMLSIVDELKCYRIGSRRLSEAVGQLEGTLAVKTQELAWLMEAYEARCELGMQDPRDRLQLLCDHIRSRGFGKELRLYVDGFFGFTAMEVELLEAFLEQGTELTVCLCCDDLFHGAQVFSSVRRTARVLMNAADRAGTRVEVRRIDGTDSAICNAALSAFSRQKAESWDGLRLYQCGSIREEAQSVCADILDYVRNGGRYRDISVACADAASLRPIIEAEFERAGIPVFFAEKRTASRTPLIHGIISALRAASGRMEQEDVLAWLKSDCAPLTRSDCDLLENYCILWSISGERWEQNWTMHPRGMDCKMEPQDALLLEQLNSLRKACIVPLLRLHRVLQKGGCVGKLVLAVYDFMQETEFSKGVSQRLAEMEAAGEIQAQQVTRQLYELMLHALEQLYAVQYDLERSGEEFVRLMEILLSQYQVGAIPAVLDAVSVGECAAFQHRETKLLYVCGCMDGCLPQVGGGGSLLNEQERSRLRTVGVELAPDENEQTDRAIMSVYLLLCAPQTRLCLSVGGEQSAYLFQTLCKLYPEAVSAGSKAPAPAYANAKTLGLHLARCGMDLPAPPEAEAYRNQLRSRARYDFAQLDRTQVQALYGQTLRLSASRIDRYAACRFAFFLQDGLRAQERKAAAFDAPVYGTLVHYVLEQTLREVKSLGGINCVEDGDLHNIARRHMDVFLKERIDPMLLQSERFTYLLRRNYQEMSHVLDILARELRSSGFVPTDFELRFAPDGDIPAVEIQTGKNRANIIGSVDRVDLFETQGHTFYRVVDYKTGRKKFDYTDILEGRGLQMLIYLFALKQLGPAYYGKQLHPAGVLYVPAHDDYLRLPKRPERQEDEKDRMASHKREGLLLNDPIVLQAMEPCGEASPTLLPYKMGKDGPKGDLMSFEQRSEIEHYVNNKLTEMTDAIFEGNIMPNPYDRGGIGACTYCPYGSVCHRDLCRNEVRYLAATSAEQFWAQLARKEAHNG